MYWNDLNSRLKAEYGCKVYKLALSSGCSCPNRDGTLDTRGCIFCDGAGAFAEAGAIPDQLAAARLRVAAKAGTDAKYIAYFQSFTNTYGDADRLRALYQAAMAPEDVVILSIATRPDCLGPDILGLLEDLNRVKPVWVELGLQTIHPESARYLRRGYDLPVFDRAVKDLNQFDLNNLRWSKVILCTDGDVDGFQIRTLILTMLYRLCPTLIREGYVYIAETPLFEITCKEKTWFAYSEKEKADILKSLEGKKVKVDRSKGLGENDPEMMWLTTMNPETRRLVKVLPDDAEETARVFDLLLGDNLAGRKDYIAENGHLYLDMIDVS